MRFLVDRCAGRRLADWLVEQRHDAVHLASGEDPGDVDLLRVAVSQQRILVTLDTDFGDLVFRQNLAHHGIIRLPDVSAAERITLVRMVIDRYADRLNQCALITIRGDRVRVTRT